MGTWAVVIDKTLGKRVVIRMADFDNEKHIFSGGRYQTEYEAKLHCRN